MGNYGRDRRNLVYELILSVPNPSFAKSSLEYAKHCLEMCRLVDGKQVNVCLTSDYQSISTYQLTHGFKLDSEKRHIVESRVIPMLTGLTRIAKDNDVKLLLEPLNGSCSRFCNTAKEAVEIAKRVNDDSFGVLLDTYHMNIEESSIEARYKIQVNGCDILILQITIEKCQGMGILNSIRSSNLSRRLDMMNISALNQICHWLTSKMRQRLRVRLYQKDRIYIFLIVGAELIKKIIIWLLVD